MTDYAMPQPFLAVPRSAVRPGRPAGILGAAHYGLVLLVLAGLFVVRPRLAIQVFRERRADSPIRRFGR